MKKSNLVWLGGCLPVILLVGLLGVAPAKAQSADTGLLGGMGGLRTALGTYGITLGVTDNENLLGNLSGGVKRGATVQGVATAALQVDTGVAFGLRGGTLNMSALQIHGQNLTPAYLHDLQAANGNEAEDATRLWEFWYDQLFDYSRADIKLGQQSIDNEFIISKYSGLFVNTMAGWPLIPSDDLYGGGPAYPLASLGVRLQYKPADNDVLLGGVFDDNPGGGAFSDDAQALDGRGGKFNLNTGALFIAEFQYTTNQPAVGALVHNGGQQAGLPGTYKIGFWYDTAFLPDQRFGTDGLSLADPASNAIPPMRKGNYSVYAIADQPVWQSAADRSRGVNIFARVMAAPAGQNLISFSFNGGVTVTAPLPGRDNDQAGIDVGVGKVSSRAASLDRDTSNFTGAYYPVRTTEELVELTYQAQLTPWVTLQPDIQYVVNPGAGILNESGTKTLRNELVAGARCIIAF